MCVSSEVEHVCGKRKEESRDEDIASIINFFSVIHFFLLIPTQARGPKRHGQCFTCDFFLHSNFAGFPHTQARGHASRGHWFCRFTWDFFSCHSFFPCFFHPHAGTGICGTRAREALCGPQANKSTAAAAPALCVTLASIPL